MSASSKKKLRREQDAAKMTEKQLAAQKEAKKTNLFTISFFAVMAILLVVAITVGVNQTLNANGIPQKNTTALTVGEHKLNSVEMNYFYVDAVENFYGNYGSYASLFGLDVSKPLNEQYVDEESGITWADDFYSSAKSTAQAVYALADAAEAAGYALSEDERATVEYNINNIDTYATLYGYSSADAFLQSRYGRGATKDSYLAYQLTCSLADSYRSYYSDSLVYTDADFRAVDGEKFENYSSFTYNSYYLSASKFDSAADAEAAAKTLTGADITSIEALDAAIAGLSINADTNASSTAYTDVLYTSLNSSFSEWISNSSRKAGDLGYFPSTSTDADGHETVNGYYVVYFVSANDNLLPLANVRHILVSFEGGTTDEATGATTYSDQEKAAAKAAAEELLAQWQSGEKTEDSFAALAKEHTGDTGSAANGGLYENVYPGQMVVNFNDWCFDESRKPGDTGIVESNYGYHVMYYVGQSDLTYRDYLIETELRNADVLDWYNALVEATTVTDGETKYLNMGLVLSPAA